MKNPPTMAATPVSKIGQSAGFDAVFGQLVAHEVQGGYAEGLRVGMEDTQTRPRLDLAFVQEDKG